MSWPASMLLSCAPPFTAGLCSHVCPRRHPGQAAASLCQLSLNNPEQGDASQPEGSACGAEQALSDSRLSLAKGVSAQQLIPCMVREHGNMALAPQSLLRLQQAQRTTENRKCPACSRVYITYLVLLLVTVVITYIIYRIGKAKLA